MYMLSKYVNEKQAYELAQGIQRVCRLKDIHISFRYKIERENWALLI